MAWIPGSRGLQGLPEAQPEIRSVCSASQAWGQGAFSDALCLLFIATCWSATDPAPQVSAISKTSTGREEEKVGYSTWLHSTILWGWGASPLGELISFVKSSHLH